MYNVNTDLHLVPDCVKRFCEDLQGQSEQKKIFHRLLESWDCVFLFLFFMSFTLDYRDCQQSEEDDWNQDKRTCHSISDSTLPDLTCLPGWSWLSWQNRAQRVTGWRGTAGVLRPYLSQNVNWGNWVLASWFSSSATISLKNSLRGPGRRGLRDHSDLLETVWVLFTHPVKTHNDMESFF